MTNRAWSLSHVVCGVNAWERAAIGIASRAMHKVNSRKGDKYGLPTWGLDRPQLLTTFQFTAFQLSKHGSLGERVKPILQNRRSRIGGSVEHGADDAVRLH